MVNSPPLSGNITVRLCEAKSCWTMKLGAVANRGHLRQKLCACFSCGAYHYLPRLKWNSGASGYWVQSFPNLMIRLLRDAAVSPHPKIRSCRFICDPLS